ncbi:rho guanine nucleotide exchange factor 10 isoform X1 [Tribolium castaneum]|uniref:Rho guanine nucleotide exchange factor 10-like Protein n=1 Tax=Tribolium castaneum TaxID=7070 RepID=A0A139WBV7_TRICA|nr:PREDICTED: rho guanine nucleotide exchange factor 10 isoform X1 [Tribolium castaneum]XP_008198192.1 PREDICTED: rho guanine nucleotide exchange factor 10 isoform X1 [Tribolium castaneum]KYB25331.1 Rho guanine nucleotide exchange factor 10-like Protein [Tribolium castaneum]|eukprot:XP_008198191.1 PREDICTED: rho guanine nucleotide exchange factor 10 isoform X1 [Tribolium castaneum]
MWRSSRSARQQCEMEQLNPLPDAGLFGIIPQSSPHGRRAHLQFPPPPNYPPPSTSAMSEEHLLSAPGPSSQNAWDLPNDYSYAYYVPGPPTRHTNVPSRYPGYREGSYRTRHTYLTRYGTEENIYEEISEVARARLRPQQSIMSINQSLVEEELRRVQTGHRRVLGELNLSIEAMLMPSSSREGSDDTDREEGDQLADLLTVGPTDDLLSPVPLVDLDSGFSGSSSGASYRSAGGSLRRGPERPKSAISTGPRTSTPTEGQKGFWGKKAWRKLTGFPSNISLNKQKDEPRIRSGTWEEASCEHRVPGRTLQHTVSQRSSEDSWCSGSDAELSSDGESDRSATSNSRVNSTQFRNTLNKAKTLCDKFRASGGIGSNHRLSLDGTFPDQASQANQGKLSRWFSIRRGSTHQYDIENVDGKASPGNKMPLLPEVEEENVFNCSAQQRRQVPPALPPPPQNLTPQQLKRRMIVAAIVHSENSYVATLQRLVNDYKKPLEESSPAILSASKIHTLFHRLPEILQCHTLFRIALAESVRNWDRDEKIGDVFVASFSKAIVLDIYSGFINNFSVAMDLAKMEAKRKSALADFLKVKQISSHDRLSFFGLMVKPVQRFPQFILFLQDLLKHTPQGHHDRMSLQLALTQLESLAEMLNERKREAEQYQAFKEMLRHISGKFSVRPLSDCNRYLLREDNVMQLEYNQSGMITKAKNRRLLLLNDLIVCVSVAPKPSDDFGTSERLNLKWTYPVADVEIQDTSASPTLSRVLTAGLTKGGSVKSNSSFDGQQPQDANNLCTEMSNLMHDYEIMSRISDLVGSLKGNYKDITLENTRKILHQIQTSIQQKDEEMAWVDSCCLQLVVKTKGKEEIFTFKTDNPSIKKEWITELRLAQLALDPNNSPAWEVPEQEQRPSTKMPLFVKSQCVYKSQHQTEVRCGCYYTVNSVKTTRRRHRTQNYLWICTTDGASSHIAILSQHHQQASVLKDVTSFSLVETQVTAMEFVKGAPQPCPSLASDSVWMGTDSHRLLLYAADEPEKQEEIGSAAVSDVITQIKCHCDSVFVALANGTLNVYRRNVVDGSWLLQEPQIINLGSEAVSSLLPINSCLYAACGKKVWVISGLTGEVQKNFSIQHEHVGNVNLMAHSGIGLWISLKHSSTICLYHTETFKHLQDINIASNVMRVTTPSSGRDCVNNNRSQVNVTALLACKGLLWVGTNVGITLTIPLPRLEGVPIISGRVNISYHAHFGPISFLLALQPKTGATPKKDETPQEDRPKMEKQLSDTSMSSKLRYFTSSPVVVRRRKSKDCDMSRLSKTLPRGFGNGGSIFSTSSNSSQVSGDTCDVYGLYGELMYIRDYEGEEHMLTDPIYESLRRSDPELAIPNKVSTLDRRLKMKVSRPRSLDLSNWSVDSRSSSLCTSSGSEESMALRHGAGRSVSRNNSNASRQLNEVSESEEKAPAASKTLSKGGVAVDNARRTVITLMGGRGYVNFRQPCCPADKSKNSFSIRESNRNDAHIVIWELKL